MGKDVTLDMIKKAVKLIEDKNISFEEYKKILNYLEYQKKLRDAKTTSVKKYEDLI